jgi:hypothetical protein
MIQIKVYTDDINFQYQRTNQPIGIPDQSDSTVLIIQNVSPLNTNDSVLIETIKSYSGLFQNMATLNDYITKSVIYQLNVEDPGNPTILQLYSFYHVPEDFVKYLYKTQEIPLFIPIDSEGNINVEPVFKFQQVLKTWQEIKADFENENYPLLKIEVPNFNHYIESLV